VGITLAIYKDQYEGAPLWLEPQNIQADAKGNYTVQLGSTKPDGLPLDLFSSGEARWLGVTVNGGQEQPRVLLLSVPYALKAADAETIGGLPPSAFVLAAPPISGAAGSGSGSSVSPSTSTSGAPPATSNVTTTGGTVNALPLWTTASNIQSSAVTQTGSGTTARIGIGTTTPAATLDVKGAETVRGVLTLPATSAATATKGANSQPQDLVASSFSSSTSKAVNQTFQWQAEPAANNTANPSGTLNLLFGSGTTAPAETGLKLSGKGLFTFATGQTFPGTGTITGVTTGAGSGLSGGGTTGSLTLSLLKTCSTNQVLRWSGAAWACATIGGTGTVTSVALAAPAADFKVSGSPITGAGTLDLAWTVTPASANTANAIVKRDGSGNFAANAVTANSVTGSTVTGTTVNAVDVNLSDTAIISSTNFNAIVATSSSTLATTVSAFASAASGPTIAVEGQTNSSDPGAKGVLGVDNATVGTGEGVNGVSLSPVGLGVAGQGGSSSFSSTALTWMGIQPIGMLGDSSLSGGVGVHATADDGYALRADNNSGYPTVDFRNSGNGLSFTAGGNTGFVDIFPSGDLTVSGTIHAGVKDFRIDHPLDPSGKYLTHASIESSEMLNLYTGNAVLGADGSAAVSLPDWFTALNDDFRYQLTPIGGFAQLYIAEEITGNQFRIAGGRAGMKVSWQVTGVRQDAYAKAHPLVVESDKQGEERGHYLHPDAFGQPLEMGITAVHRAKLHAQRAAKPSSAPVILKGLGVTKRVAR
jgi:hypothetical protein